MTTITEPGIFHGMPETTYRDPATIAATLGRALSPSSAKTILTNPERYAWERDHGRAPKTAYDEGSLIHALVLRSHDNRIRVVDATDWRTKQSQAARDDAHTAGFIPVHRGQLRDAARVAGAVRRHPLAGAIFRTGEPEVSMVWVDEETGVTCRGRVDWLTAHPAIVDLKTTTAGGADLGPLGRSAAALDYPLAAAAYVDGYRTLTGVTPAFLTVAVEKTAPHIVTVARYRPEDLATGLDRWRAALAEFARRESSGEWVDPPTIRTIPVPGWYGHTIPPEEDPAE